MRKIFTLFAALMMVLSMSAATWTVAGEPAAVFHNHNWSNNAAANDMVQQADGTFKWERTDLTLAENTKIQFKVCKDHGWATAYPSSNYELIIQKSGIYTITITFNPSGNKVEATATLQEEQEVIATVAVKGAWDNWANTTAFTLAEDKKTAATTIAVSKAGDFKFGLEVNGGFVANGGTVSRTTNSVANLSGNTGDMTLKADMAGDYTFTWEYATKTLTVTYPALPVKYNVTVTAENGTVTGAGEYEEGKEATLTATPAEGYEFVNWTKGEEVVSTENPYKFTVTADVALVANFKEAEPEYDVKDITMTNLVVQEMEDFVVLTASDDSNTGLNVMLAVNEDGSLAADSYMALLQGWNEVELPIVEGEITKTFNEELATDVYTGLVVVECGEGLLGLNLTMYAKPVVATDVVVTDATITVETKDDGVGGTYEIINIAANWNGSVLEIEGVEKAHEGFVQIKQVIDEATDDWYIWMCMNGVITTVDNVLTVKGEFTNNWTGDVYNVTISGTLPAVPSALDNLNTTVAPVKAIVNGQLIIVKDGVQYNAQGAILK